MLAAVRVRGLPDTRKKARETMKALRLNRKNNCMLYADSESSRGMLDAVKDYISYGDVESETVRELVKKRGVLEGEGLEDVISSLDYDDIGSLVDDLEAGEVSLADLNERGLQLPFRLSPPSKGFKDTRRHHGQGGSLGRRDDMDDLLRRMI